MVTYRNRIGTRVDTRHRQVAQSVSHVMLDHMSSTGVMRGDGRRRREEMVKHDRKRENISAVHTRYRNKRKGLCHLCKKHGHIQRHCPEKTPEQPARAARMPTIPLITDQGIKCPQSPAVDGDDVLRYLKRTTPENRNEVAAELMKPTTRQDFSLT